jgi:tripartite-type tricarboxylate transporter receptor subunit TctC
LRLAAGAALPALPAIVGVGSLRADNYPTRPVRIVVGFAPGGGTDFAARLIAQWLSEHLGQPFIVENRSGAGGNIAVEAVVRATPDGYTLLFFTSSAAINTSLYDNLGYDLMRDTEPVASVSRGAYAMVVSPSFPAATLADFIAYAKANPGKINMAAAGTGTRVSGELLKMKAGIDMTAVQYRGGAPALTDVMSGQVQVFFSPLPEPTAFIRAGQLRALAVTTATRTPALPDVPAIAEVVPGVEASAWVGLAAPKHTPAPVIETLNAAINAGLADAKIRDKLGDLGNAVFTSSPAEFARFIADETEKWAKVVKFAGLKPE